MSHRNDLNQERETFCQRVASWFAHYLNRNWKPSPPVRGHSYALSAWKLTGKHYGTLMDFEDRRSTRGLVAKIAMLPVTCVLFQQFVIGVMFVIVFQRRGRDSVRRHPKGREPGDWVLRLSDRLLGHRATERIFSQLVADMRDDLTAARRTNSRFQIIRAYTYGYSAIAKAAGLFKVLRIVGRGLLMLKGLR